MWTIDDTNTVPLLILEVQDFTTLPLLSFIEICTTCSRPYLLLVHLDKLKFTDSICVLAEASRNPQHFVDLMDVNVKH